MEYRAKLQTGWNAPRSWFTIPFGGAMQWKYEADRPESLVETPYIAKWNFAAQRAYSHKHRYFSFTQNRMQHVGRLINNFDTTTAGIEIDQHQILEFIIKVYNNIHSLLSLIKLKLVHPPKDIQATTNNESCS